MKLTKQSHQLGLVQPTHVFGIDLGDLTHRYCLIDFVSGELIEEGKLTNSKEGFENLLRAFPFFRVIIECGW